MKIYARIDKATADLCGLYHSVVTKRELPNTPKLSVFKSVFVAISGVRALNTARARSMFGASIVEFEVFCKQMYCIEESTCDLVGTFRCPYSDSAPVELYPPWTPFAGPSPAGGGQWCPAPILNRCPPFHVWPPGCYIHPILYIKNVPLLLFDFPCC